MSIERIYVELMRLDFCLEREVGTQTKAKVFSSISKILFLFKKYKFKTNNSGW